MDHGTYTKLKKENPWLGVLLTMYYVFPKKLDAVEYIPPTSNPQYHSFCKRLQLRDEPALFIVDESKGASLPVLSGRQYQAFHNPISNTVFVTKELYESFLRQNIRGQYLTAHELGHSKFRESVDRRNFLRLGFPLAVGLASGGWTSFSTGKVADTLGQQKHSSKVRSASFLLSACPSWYLANKAFERVEEFSADRLAEMILKPEDMIRGLGQDMQEFYESKPYGKRVGELKQVFEHRLLEFERERKKDLSPEQREVSWLIFLSEEMSRGMKANIFTYPKTNERIAALRSRIVDPDIMR